MRIAQTFHSDMRRAQSLMTSDGMGALPGIGEVGRVEKRCTRLRGSCMSCNARVKVGYLYISMVLRSDRGDVPLLDQMVQPHHRLGLFQVLGQTPFLPPDSSCELFGKRLVIPKSSE